MSTGFVASPATPGYEFASQAPTSAIPVPPEASFVLTNSRMNVNRGLLRGKYPVPSSLHPGTIIVAFSDTKVKPINDNINQQVYVRLITSGGARHGQAAVSESDF